VLAALADAQLAAAAAAQGHDSASSANAWTALQSAIQQYDPLASSQHSHARTASGQGGTTPACTVNLPVVSSSMLEHLPAMAVLRPGDMYAYVCADLLAAALWAKYLQEDPLDPTGWLALRHGLFESDARAGAAAVVQQLLGAGSMQEVAVQLQQSARPVTARGGASAGGVSVCGWVPNLEHPCFQDIDLWG
jgi:hypothetical protein